GEVDGTMDKMTNNVEEKLGTRLKGVLREAQAAFMPFGEMLVGMAEKAMPTVSAGLEKVTNVINGLSPAAKTMTIVFAGIAAAIGPVLTIAGMLIGAFGNIVTALGPLLANIARAGGLLKFLRLGLIAMTGPIGITIGALTLLGSGFIALYRNSETFRQGVSNLIGKLKEFGVNALAALKPAIDAVVAFFKAQLATINKFWQENGATIMQALSNIGSFVKNTFYNVILPVINFVMPFILALIRSVWGNIKGVITGALNVIMGAVKLFSGLLTGDFSKMWAGVKQIFFGAIQFIWNFIQLQFIGRIVKGIAGFVGTIGTSLRNGWTSAISGIKTFVGSAKSWFDDMLTSGRNKFDGLVKAAKELPGKIGTGIKNMAGKATDGIKSMANKMAQK
ncbi:MAG: hypothetical protein ACI35R_10570, partial [Bacillus sp. (in: firmicutes)]